MAKVSIKAREAKKQRMVKLYAEKRKQLKSEGDYEALDKLPRLASPVKLRNRCNVTGRGRGYIRDFGISRILFRELALRGKIPGVKKSS